MSPQHQQSNPSQQSNQSDQQPDEPYVQGASCHQAASWIDFTSSWNAFNSTASNWWESAAASWQPTLREAEEEDFQPPSPPRDGNNANDRLQLSNAKQDARRHPYHNRSTAAAVATSMKELSKMSSHTLTSSSSASEQDEDDESIWCGNGLQIFPTGTGTKNGYGGGRRGGRQHGQFQVEKPSKSSSNNEKSSSCCCCLQNKSLKYKFAVGLLVLAIMACAAVVVLTSMDISKRTSNNTVDDNSSAKNRLADDTPTKSPTQTPTPNPTAPPTTSSPTTSPTEEALVTYIPGKLTVHSNGLLLSEGLQSKIVATAGQPVQLTGLPPLQTSNSEAQSELQYYYKSSQPFHEKPDGAAIFPWTETGGWVYVSNSEVKEQGQGGVGAIYFDRDGNVLDYQRLLDGTTMNCSGGPTPWGTWVSCEEIDGGKAYQVDPFGIRPPEALSTLDTGFFEAFAHDTRNPQEPKFYVTEDKERGPLRRITPSNPDWQDPWNILHGPGRLEYLVLEPNHPQDDLTKGTYYWTTERETAKVNSQQYYKNSEGIDVHNHELFFVSKEQKELFILNLDTNTYQVHSTVSGVFDGHPDQMKRLIHNGLLYFCEEGGKENGVHARDENGWFFTILESSTLNDETTGLAFSPDGKHMYVSFQHNGLIFDVFREDGLPFHGRTLNVKYHQINAQRR